MKTSRSERIAAINATAAKIKAERPVLGEWCDILSKCHGHTSYTDQRTWVADIENKLFPDLADPVPIRGMYVGFRIVYEGKRYTNNESSGYLAVSKSIQVWIFVINERKDPIYAFPRHVRRDSQNDSGKEIENGD